MELKGSRPLAGDASEPSGTSLPTNAIMSHNTVEPGGARPLDTGVKDPSGEMVAPVTRPQQGSLSVATAPTNNPGRSLSTASNGSFDPTLSRRYYDSYEVDPTAEAATTTLAALAFNNSTPLGSSTKATTPTSPVTPPTSPPRINSGGSNNTSPQEVYPRRPSGVGSVPLKVHVGLAGWIGHVVDARQRSLTKQILFLSFIFISPLFESRIYDVISRSKSSMPFLRGLPFPTTTNMKATAP